MNAAEDENQSLASSMNPTDMTDEYRAVQAELYEKFVKGSVTVDCLQMFKDYLDKDIIIDVDKECDCGREFENEAVSAEGLETTLDLIKGGRCQCTKSVLCHYKVKTGKRLVHLASQVKADKDIFQFLCTHSDINAVTLRFKMSVLTMAIVNNDLEQIQFLISNHVNVNQIRQNVEADTPLTLAMDMKRTEAMEILLKAEGINLNLVDRWLQTPLLYSIRHNSQYTEALLKAGANPNIAGPRGNYPLMYAVAQGHKELVQLLVKHGADVNSKNDRLECCLFIAMYRDAFEIMDMLLEGGADPNFQTEGDGNTLLIMASYDGSDVAIKNLIKYKADVNMSNKQGYCPLHIAAWNGHVSTVNLLLEAGAKHDIRTADKNTPLSLSAHGGHKEVMDILLPLGCNVNNEDKDNDTAIHYATFNGMTEAVKTLMQYGANPCARNRINVTPLWNAVYGGHIEVVKMLIAANVELEVPSVGIHQHSQTDDVVYIFGEEKSPLWVSVFKNYQNITMLLVSTGYNIYQEKWLVEGKFPQETQDITRSLLNQYISSPPRLIAICRTFFRKRFGQDIVNKAEKLDIPNILKNFLVLKDLIRRN